MRAKEIDRLVGKCMDVPVGSIHAKRGSFVASEARYIAMYLRKKFLHQSLNSMAREWGYSNHTVTRAGVLNVQNHIETEKALREKVKTIEIIVQHRLDIITRNKRKYNDHFLLKQKGVSVDAKLKIVSLSEEQLEELKKGSKKMVDRLVGFGYGVQYEISL